MSENRSNIMQILFLGLALFTGAIAILVIWYTFDSYNVAIEENRQQEDKVMVMFAARDLYQGVKIVEDDVYMLAMEPDLIPDHTFTNHNFVVGRYPQERILQNEPIRNERLANPRQGIGLNAYISTGYRGISIEVNKGEALEGFLTPGDHVDVQVSYELEDMERTEILLEDVVVLAVNDVTEAASTGAGRRRSSNEATVTLLVDFDEAEDLAFYDNIGEIRLLLRPKREGAGGSMTAAADSVDINEIFPIRTRQMPAKPSATTKAPPAAGVLIIQGDQTSSSNDGK